MADKSRQNGYGTIFPVFGSFFLDLYVGVVYNKIMKKDNPTIVFSKEFKFCDGTVREYTDDNDLVALKALNAVKRKEIKRKDKINDMMTSVGKIATMKVSEDFFVNVKILDVGYDGVFKKYLVEPVSGAGERWVKKITF